MWAGAAGGQHYGHPPTAYGTGAAGSTNASSGMSTGGGGHQQKHDIFVGNLNFSTTEEQLHQAFSEIGRVLKVRMVHDLETGKPRGFAFIEFEDPQAALSAIRNMNDYELNGRRIRVNFSNSSHLEALAGKLGMDLSSTSSNTGPGGASRGANTNAPDTAVGAGGGTQAIANSLKGFSKSEMYDVVAKLKEIADKDPDEARRLLSGHPQLPEAMLHLMSKLEMIQTPIAVAAPPPPVLQMTTASATTVAPAPTAKDPRARPVDPRAAAAAAKTTANVSQPQASLVPPPPASLPMDPRQRMAVAASDPRQQQQQQQQSFVSAAGGVPPPPPPPPPRPGLAPTTVGATPSASAVAHLDPALVQQVMSLTEEQIRQLPPDKQQSIRMLRQQITGAT